jgi:hypothetical protein
MLNTLPPEIIHSIYAAIKSVSTATSLARCSKYLNTVWIAHLRTADLVKDFSDDPRWADKRYKNFAFTIARARLDASDGLETAKAAYRIAGVINRTASELNRELQDHSMCCNYEEWGRWLERVLRKSLYVLWIKKLLGVGPRKPASFFPNKTLCEYLLQPRWLAFGFPSLQGVLGAVRPSEKAPVWPLLQLCMVVEARVARNKKAVDGKQDSELDEFSDDADMDDIAKDLDAWVDSEDEDEDEDDSEWWDSADVCFCTGYL